MTFEENQHQPELALGPPAEATPHTLDSIDALDPGEQYARAAEAGFRHFCALAHHCETCIQIHLEQQGEHSHKIRLDVRDAIDSAAKATIGRIVRCARLQFGYAGREVPIDESDIVELFWPHPYRIHERIENNPAAFSPVKIWQHLRAKYAGSGRDLALADAARVLVSKLPIGGRHGDRQIRQVGGLMVFDLWFRGEQRSSFSGGHGAYAISMHERSNDGMPALAHAFATFLAWASGLDDVPTDVANEVGALKQFIYGGSFDLRDKMTIGCSTLVFFKSKCELKLPLNVAEKLNLFLAEFAAEQLARRFE